MRWSGAGPFPRAVELRRRIWFQEPGQIRVELFRGQQPLQVGVRDAESWWRWDHARGEDTGATVGADGGWTLPPGLDPPLLAPARLIARFWFEPAGVGQRLGREVLIARAFLRRPPPRDVELSFEFEFEATCGVVLRRAAFENGHCVQVTEALNVRLDEPIDRGRFAFVRSDA